MNREAAPLKLFRVPPLNLSHAPLVKLLPHCPPLLTPGRLANDPLLQQLVPLAPSPSRSTYSATHCRPLRIRCSFRPHLVHVLQTCIACCCVCLLVLLLLKLAEITQDLAHDWLSVRFLTKRLSFSSSERSLTARLAAYNCKKILNGWTCMMVKMLVLINCHWNLI
jgi:hypothetical protein